LVILLCPENLSGKGFQKNEFVMGGRITFLYLVILPVEGWWIGDGNVQYPATINEVKCMKFELNFSNCFSRAFVLMGTVVK
jgi:hypothetical protein